MSDRKTNAGFTLIEMLVALAIIMGIVTMVYGSYVATTKSMGAHQARMACSERAQLVLRLMARQIRCAYAPFTDPNDETTVSPGETAGMTTTASNPRTGTTETRIRRPSTCFWGDSRGRRGKILSFVTTGGPAAGPEARRGLSRITYLYDKATATLSIGTQECMDLFRSREDAGRAQPVLNNVTAIDLGFHDGRQWQDEWDYEKNERLPHAVKFEFTVMDENAREHHYGTTIAIMCRVHSKDEKLTSTRLGRRP